MDVSMAEDAGLDAAARKRHREQSGDNTADASVQLEPKAPRGDDGLIADLTDEEWQAIDAGLGASRVVLVFTMDTSSIEMEGAQWSLRELRTRVLRLCASRGVEFEDGELTFVGGDRPRLTGCPKHAGRALWLLLKPGYVSVGGHAVFVQPEFTGKKRTNVSLLELEYQNINELSPSALRKYVNKLGAVDVVVVSHASNLGKPVKWKAATCISSCTKTTPEPTFAFRLFFYSEGVVNKVLANYKCAASDNGGLLSPREATAVLKPVVGCDWDFVHEKVYRLAKGSHEATSTQRVLVFELTAAITQRRLGEAFSAASFPVQGIEIRGLRRTHAVVHLQSAEIASRCLEHFTESPMIIDNLTLRVEAPKDPTVQLCNGCRQPGHFVRDCPANAKAATAQELVVYKRPQELNLSALRSEVEKMLSLEVERRMDALQVAHQQQIAVFDERLRATSARLMEHEKKTEELLSRNETVLTGMQQNLADLTTNTERTFAALNTRLESDRQERVAERAERATMSDNIQEILAYMRLQQSASDTQQDFRQRDQ